jgi:SAM-dependent methyltransferase
MKPAANLLADVAEYYSGKLAEHGDTARGVDWNGEESQNLRFAQLCKLVTEPANFSLNDVGCGYGAMLGYLDGHYHNVAYHGCDVSADMVTAAKARAGKRVDTDFTVGAKPSSIADYSVASGIFNVRLSHHDADWKCYMQTTLAQLHASSSKGFAFNCLTSYSDADKMRDYLFYANPGECFDYCKKHFSRDVALLHDYGLYEFTILVRKP